MKIVISNPETGLSYQKEVNKETKERFYNKKIGDEFNGELIDLQGYKLRITGGSDKSGFPMRPEIRGSGRKKVLLTKGVGFRTKRKGLRKKKNVRGHIVNESTAQLNTKVVETGKKELEAFFEEGEEGEDE